jgi:hypothetical protein
MIPHRCVDVINEATGLWADGYLLPAISSGFEQYGAEEIMPNGSSGEVVIDWSGYAV